MKIFSSTRTPSGIHVKYAQNPQEAAVVANHLLKTYDWSQVAEQNRQAEKRRVDTIIHDAQQQGFEEPIKPYTAFRRGKTRDVYDRGDGTLSIVATDRVSAFDQNMHEKIPGKGDALTELSEYWFKLTDSIIPNHFIERTDKNEIRVQKATRIDVECVIRGYIYGSLFRDYEKGKRELYDIKLPDGLQRAEKFKEPIFTPTTKADIGHDEELRKQQAIEMHLVRDEKEWDTLYEATHKLYEFYTEHALKKGIIIPDFKVEFGRLKNGDLIQIDEPPNHDSARLWLTEFYKVGQRQEGHAFDKEYLRDTLSRGYNYKGDGAPPNLPPQVVDQISKRCTGATQILTGKKTNISDFGLISVDQLLQELQSSNKI